MGAAEKQTVMMVPMSPEDFAKLVRESVRAELESRAANESPPGKPIMNPKEAAEYLNISTRTITNLVKKGMPYERVGHLLRFRRADLDAWRKRKT